VAQEHLRLAEEEDTHVIQREVKPGKDPRLCAAAFALAALTVVVRQSGLT